MRQLAYTAIFVFYVVHFWTASPCPFGVVIAAAANTFVVALLLMPLEWMGAWMWNAGSRLMASRSASGS